MKSAALTPAEIAARFELDRRFDEWRADRLADPRAQERIEARAAVPQPPGLSPVTDKASLLNAIAVVNAANPVGNEGMVRYVSQRASDLGLAARLPSDWPRRFREPLPASAEPFPFSGPLPVRTI
jgi:hypothetical protein